MELSRNAQDRTQQIPKWVKEYNTLPLSFFLEMKTTNEFLYL